MSSINITKSTEGYLVELLEKQESDTIGVKVFVSDPGSPKAETCIAYCKNDDDIGEYEIRDDLSFKLYLGIWSFYSKCAAKLIRRVINNCIFYKRQRFFF